MDDYAKKKKDEEKLAAWKAAMASNGKEFQKGFLGESEDEKKKKQQSSWTKLSSMFGG